MLDTLLEQVAKIELHEARIKELESKLKENSSDSHRPPSFDGLEKPTRKLAFPRKKGRKQGGQSGHKGGTLEMVAEADDIELHAPKVCSCGHDLTIVSRSTIEKRQVFDLPEPKLEVMEHQLQSCTCPNCGKLNVGSFLDEVPARVQYGSGIRALTVLLYNAMNLPYGVKPNSSLRIYSVMN